MTEPSCTEKPSKKSLFKRISLFILDTCLAIAIFSSVFLMFILPIIISMLAFMRLVTIIEPSFATIEPSFKLIFWLCLFGVLGLLIAIGYVYSFFRFQTYIGRFYVKRSSLIENKETLN